jgi:hypothetical protein
MVDARPRRESLWSVTDKRCEDRAACLSVTDARVAADRLHSLPRIGHRDRHRQGHVWEVLWAAPEGAAQTKAALVPDLQRVVPEPAR